MARELDVVLWHDDLEAALRFLDLDQLQDLQVVVVDVVRQRERAYIDDVHVWVLDAKYSRNLLIFLLLELFDGEPLVLTNTHTIDMDFNALILTDVRPALLELVLHLAPDADAIRSQLLQLLLRLVLELPQSVALLDLPGLDHKELQLLEVAKCFIVTPRLLYHDGCHDWASGALEHLLRILDDSEHLRLVADC